MRRIISNAMPGRALVSASQFARWWLSEPSVARFDFANDGVLVQDAGTPANNFASTVQAAITAGILVFTRASAATYFDVTGAMATAASGAWRRTYDPVTHQPLGYLVEPQRTNLLLNSTSLSTQSVTVTAQAYTLSFYGTGTITLSGVSTAGPLVGTGAASRVSLTFTPTAGTLTLTVSGTVTNAQIEASRFATSYITTAGASATRAADVLYADLTKLPSLAGGSGTVLFFGYDPGSGATTAFSGLSVDDTTSSNIIRYRNGSSATRAWAMINGGVAQAAMNGPSAIVGHLDKSAFAWASNDAEVVDDGASSGTDSSLTVPTGLSRLHIGGRFDGGEQWTQPISSLVCVPRRMTSAEMVARTQ